METQDIKNMGLAYLQVLEAMKKKKMDKVDADELKGSHADRDDKDIDNDGDVDKSDEYLHNRRKAIKAAITKEEVEMDEAKKMSISAKQIKAALASAKAQAKPKDQVSLKKAPFDIPKESVVYEAMSNNIVDRLHNGEDTNRHMGHEGGYRQHKSAAEDARADGNTKAASSHERAAMSHEHAAKNLKAGKHEVALRHSKDAARHAMLAVKHGGEETDSHEVHKDHSKAYTDFTGFKSESTERNWTILNRIQEKAIAPRDMNHVKGATPPEAMDSKESPKAKEFAATSGVPATPVLDADVVAQQTIDAIRASAAKISGNSNRPNDQKNGDKNIIKSTVAESKAFTKFRSFFS
jgi:HEPN domain-containing protein